MLQQLIGFLISMLVPEKQLLRPQPVVLRQLPGARR